MDVFKKGNQVMFLFKKKISQMISKSLHVYLYPSQTGSRGLTD